MTLQACTLKYHRVKFLRGRIEELLLTKTFLEKVTLRVYAAKYHPGYILSNKLKNLLIKNTNIAIQCFDSTLFQ